VWIIYLPFKKIDAWRRKNFHHADSSRAPDHVQQIGTPERFALDEDEGRAENASGDRVCDLGVCPSLARINTCESTAVCQFRTGFGVAR
jgi:hypothetical protein